MSFFSDTFLNLRHSVTEGLRGIGWRLIGWSAAIAVVISVATAIGALGITLLGARLLPATTESQQLLEQRTKESSELEKRLDAEAAKLKELADSQQKLESEIGDLRKRLRAK